MLRLYAENKHNPFEKSGKRCSLNKVLDSNNECYTTVINK